MKNDSPYLKHILDAISKIEEYVKNMKREEFSKDAKTQDAVVRELEIIGEATKHLSGEIKQKHSEIPWVEVAGTRDRLIHAYFDINFDEVWSTISKDIPELKDTIEEAIAELEK